MNQRTDTKNKEAVYQQAERISLTGTISKTSSESPHSRSVTIAPVNDSVRIRVVPHPQTGGDSRTD